MGELDMLRNEIDELDRELAEVLEKRMNVVMRIMEAKKRMGIPVFNREREHEVIEKVGSYVENKQFRDEIESILQKIMACSRKIQSEYLFPYHIVLVGFMGSGKSTVAGEMAEMLAKKSIDLDQLIEEKQSSSISDIFKHEGESAFREMEKDLVKDVTAMNETYVISTGGGVVLDEENVLNLKQTGVIVWLKTSAEEIYHRISENKERPLLRDDMSVEKIRSLLEQRMPLYEKAADLVIDTDQKTVKEIGLEIVKKLGSVSNDGEN